MLKKILLSAAMVLSAGCTKDNPVAVGTDALGYFPLAEGNSWVYDLTTRNDMGRDTTVPSTITLGAPLSYGGLQWFAVNGFCLDARNMNPLPTFCAEWARDGYKILARQTRGPILLEAETILDFPLYGGKMWTIKSVDTTYLEQMDTVHVVARITRRVVGIEAVTVPAGEFQQAFHVLDSTWYESQRTPSMVNHPFRHRVVADEWYGWKVGMIKQLTEEYYDDGIPFPMASRRELREYHVKVGN